MFIADDYLTKLTNKQRIHYDQYWLVWKEPHTVIYGCLALCFDSPEKRLHNWIINQSNWSKNS